MGREIFEKHQATERKALQTRGEKFHADVKIAATVMKILASSRVSKLQV